MIDPEREIVLDTWVLVHLCRDDAIGRAIEPRYQLRKRKLTPVISAVTIGEMYAFARGAGWGERKKAVLDELLRNLVVVDVSTPSVLDAYADISTWLHAHGRSVGHNDRWIAATAKALQGVVLTGDNDFAPMHPDLVRCEIVDAKTLVDSSEA